MQRPSFFKQIGLMIAKPGKLFEAIKEKPFILLPIIIAVIGGLFNGLFAAKAMSSMDLSSLPAQAKTVMQGGFLQTMGTLSMITSPLGSVIALFFNGLILWALFKIFKGKGSYMQAVSIVGFASYPFMIRDILRYFFAEPGISSYNTAELARLAKTATFGGEFVAVLGTVGLVFLIWAVILMTKGFTKVFETKAAKAAVLISVFFLAGILITTGIAYGSYQAILSTPSLNIGG